MVYRDPGLHGPTAGYDALRSVEFARAVIGSIEFCRFAGASVPTLRRGGRQYDHVRCVPRKGGSGTAQPLHRVVNIYRNIILYYILYYYR